MASGRDRIIRAYFEQGFSYHLILCILVALHGIYISLSTLKRSLRRQGLHRRRPYTTFRVVERCMLRELAQSGSLFGYRAMHQRLRTRYGIRIPREVIRLLLAAVDPLSVRLRSRRRLVRRHYSFKGPNYCWHIDGLDKLKPYGFPIHGCVDGFSRKVLWLEVSVTNNDSSVIAGYYLQAVRKHGCPRIVRCDRGTENSKVAFLQHFLRRFGQDQLAGTKSFQYGRSASNQRIEAWWSVLHKWFTDWWIEFFQMLKNTGEFDETNPMEVDCLRFSFINVLQKELDEIRNMWNTHLMRSARSSIQSGIPDELYCIPELQGYQNYVCNVDCRDIRFCTQYATPKPPHVCQEFSNLAEILMQENNWELPNDCEAALVLYCNLKNSIHTSGY